jgi:hypothetical protein
MKPDYENLFVSYKVPQAPVGLTAKILLRITKRERRILMAKIAASASVFVCSMSAVVVASRDLVAGLSHSGFFQFASLAFSDFSSIASNFPDFVYSMVESFPIFTAAVLLGGIMFSLWSMAAFIDEASLLKTYRFSISK